MRSVASVSFGKDSLAMLLLLLERDTRLDEVIFYNSGMEFQAIYDIRDRIKSVLEQRGIRFTEVKPGVPFLYNMLDRPVNSKKNGFHLGYGRTDPLLRHPGPGQAASAGRDAGGAGQRVQPDRPKPEAGQKHMGLAVVLQHLFLFRRVLEILERDGPLPVDRRLDGVDGVVHSFIVRLGGAVHVDGAVQKRGIVPTGEMAQLLDEGGALFLCNKVGGLHSVHQQL